MRIASFNLEDFPSDRPGDIPMEERIAALKPQIERLDADILCLQEVNADRLVPGVGRGFHGLTRLFEGTRHAACAWTASTVGNRHVFADKHNLVIVSSRPIRYSESIQNSLVPAPRHRAVAAPGGGGDIAVGWDRPILHAIVDLADGRALHVINIHLRAPLATPVEGQKSGPFSWKNAAGWAEGFYLSALKRCGQALEVRLLVDRILDDEPEALIAVCGDFNAEEAETPVRIIRADQEDTGNGDLADRVLVPVDRGLPESRRFSVLHGGRRLLLDHILVSRALLGASREVEVHNEALGDELVAYATGARSPDSFHAPIVAAFDLT